MGRVNKAIRRTRLQSAADAGTQAVLVKLGRSLKDGRNSRRWTQAQASAVAGVSRSEWSGLELGNRQATFATMNRAAHAVGTTLDAFLKGASAADQPRDAVHLKNQELVIRTGAIGGWQALPEELIDREARTSRAADVLLHRRRRSMPNAPKEYALFEVFDWFNDVGAPMRDWGRRLEAVDRYATARMQPNEDVPRSSGCWIVRATIRNRRLVGEHRNFFRSRLSGSGGAWLAALTDPAAPMPDRPALLWVTLRGERLYAARLG